MRNASDIFCLNEDGTDGMQMFSVNGNCPMRIKRRNQLRENECFEYGRQTTNPEQSLGRGDVTSDTLESGDSNPGQTSREGIEMDMELLHNLETQSSPQGDQRKESELQFHKINQGTDSKERVTASTIMRNPLTGAGMEIKEHRKPKKGSKNANDKWMW